MLIVNPTDESGFYDMVEFSGPEIYVFDERKKVFKPRKRGGRYRQVTARQNGL